ncbi:MAG TPA: hypothetical protein VFA29_11450 [Candidatus Baltobacteraceae bacterium]|nr:hypothetical protein [Candidatus Baltobacteraceae bacterium]
MDYIIGAGAILESGEQATITPATLHARVEPALAGRVVVAAVDFESTSPSSLQRLMLLVQGWDAATFRSSVSQALLERRECELADVFLVLAQAANVCEVHVFAHWLPDEVTCARLAQSGISLVAHPLESIEAAALVCGQRCRRWHAA